MTDPPGTVAESYQLQRLPMARLAFVLTGSSSFADEIVQEAFLKVHVNWSSIDNPGGYLRTAVVNGLSYFGASVRVGCVVTAEDLARELKVSGRNLRGFLCKTMPRWESEKHQRWLFSRLQVDHVKREFHAHFGKSTS